MDTREVLIAARKRLELPENWVGAGRPAEHGQICVTTAITPNLKPIEWQPILRLFIDCNGIEGDGVLGPIWDWNDAPERTHAEVLAAFDRAIAACSVEE